MQKDSKDAEIIFTYRLVDGTNMDYQLVQNVGFAQKNFMILIA